MSGGWRQLGWKSPGLRDDEQDGDGPVRDITLTCPVCSCTVFDEQKGRLDSRWGITSLKVIMKICRDCGLVLHFSAGRSIFDFD